MCTLKAHIWWVRSFLITDVLYTYSVLVRTYFLRQLFALKIRTKIVSSVLHLKLDSRWFAEHLPNSNLGTIPIALSLFYLMCVKLVSSNLIECVYKYNAALLLAGENCLSAKHLNRNSYLKNGISVDGSGAVSISRRMKWLFRNW